MRTKLACCSLICLGTFFFSKAALGQGSGSKESPLAIVAGQPVSEQQFSSSVKGELRRIQNQEFELKRKGLDEFVRQKLLEAEAKRKGTTPEQLLKAEVDSKVDGPTRGELEGYYLAQKQSISQPFEDVKASLRESFKQARIQVAREAYLKRLQEQAEVVTLLRPPRLDINYDPARLKGIPSAPVIIVEFSDFTCPFCRQAVSTLNGLIEKYHGKVSLAYRDFPLR